MRSAGRNAPGRVDFGRICINQYKDALRLLQTLYLEAVSYMDYIIYGIMASWNCHGNTILHMSQGPQGKGHPGLPGPAGDPKINSRDQQWDVT